MIEALHDVQMPAGAQAQAIAHLWQWLLATFAMLACTACEREARRFEPPVGSRITPPFVRLSEVQPSAADTTSTIAPHYEVNAYALAEGKRLFGW